MAGFPFSPTTLLAPMWGVLPAPLQPLIAEQGPIGLICGPFLRITSGPPGLRWLRSHVEGAFVRPLSVQLLGSDPVQMAHAARILSDAGADVIDINLGCPVRQVVDKGAGAALLRNPEQLEELLRRVRDATGCLLSAKLRAGFETRHTALELAQRVQSSGADFVTLHARSRDDMYTGVADWTLIASLKQKLQIPIVGNGDAWYAADALLLQQRTGCDAVMLGRPALRNPWIFRQIEQLRRGQAPFCPSGADVLEYLSRMAAQLKDTLGNSRKGPLGPLKEHVSWVLRSVNDGSALLRQSLQCTDIEALMRLLEHKLLPLPASALDLDAHGSHRLEKSAMLPDDLTAPSVASPPEQEPGPAGLH